MNKLHFKHIAAHGQDISQLPMIGQDMPIHITRRKNYNRPGYNYTIGNNDYGFQSGLTFDKMMIELRAIVDYYRMDWINANDDYRIKHNLKVIKHYE